MRSLIWVFAGRRSEWIRMFTVRILDSQGCIIVSCGQRRLWSDAQSDQSLRWTHLSAGTFFHVVTHLVFKLELFMCPCVFISVWNSSRWRFELIKVGQLSNRIWFWGHRTSSEGKIPKWFYNRIWERERDIHGPGSSIAYKIADARSIDSDKPMQRILICLYCHLKTLLLLTSHNTSWEDWSDWQMRRLIRVSQGALTIL